MRPQPRCRRRQASCYVDRCFLRHLWKPVCSSSTPILSFRTTRSPFSTRSTGSRPGSSARCRRRFASCWRRISTALSSKASRPRRSSRRPAPGSISLPSGLLCLTPTRRRGCVADDAEQQKIKRDHPLAGARRACAKSPRRLFAHLRLIPAAASEGIDPCHSLIGNLNQFSAAEILQMSCLGQRSGRFTFKSGRGNSEIYLHHGSRPACGLRQPRRRISGRGSVPVAAGAVLF